MCGVCGCGDSHIEGGPLVGESGHHHEGDHSHHHHHSAPPHNDGPAPVIIHHHHYYYPHQSHPQPGPEAYSPMPGHEHHGDHHHSHDHSHHETHHSAAAGQHDDLHYGQGGAGTHVPGLSQRRLMKIERDVLDKNNQVANHNRAHFKADGQLVLNLVSSPGSGKTTLLVETLKVLQSQRSCAVIEGDQQTTNDADRIRATGTQAIQVNTGKGCHLDAQMVHDACHKMTLEKNGLLFIENVGNLVCPSGFDLGEKAKVAILSVTEGDDKPLKYPNMFAASELMIINKIDLLPYVAFDIERCIENARKVNPAIQVIRLSATTGEGMAAWLSWLEQQSD